MVLQKKEPILAPILDISVVNSLCNQDFIRGVIVTAINPCIILSITDRFPEGSAADTPSQRDFQMSLKHIKHLTPTECSRGF